MKKDEMGVVYDTRGEDEKCIEDFSGEIWTKGFIWKN